MTLDRITINPAVMNGQPCVRGMRLTVRRVVEAVALYPDRTQLRAEYPELEDEDIRQALAYAAALFRGSGASPDMCCRRLAGRLFAPNGRDTSGQGTLQP